MQGAGRRKFVFTYKENLNVQTAVSMNIKILSYPHKYTEKEFYPLAYRYMYLSRRMDTRFVELFRKGLVKGTVAISSGTEATTVGMTFPLRSGKDIVSLLHRDLGGHLVLGASTFKLMCQYMANSGSPTHAREGNVHHGDVVQRRFPMISHLGNMLAVTVGGVWSARKNGEEVVGLNVIGDGGSSTGDFHESLNLASVHKVPVLYIIENNHYAFSTPTKYQYNCKRLSDRAYGYGIKGVTVDGTDVWKVYCAVCAALDEMKATALPYIIESRCLRLEGHAVYDNAEYVNVDERAEWLKREPLRKARKQVVRISGYSEEAILAIENEMNDMVEDAISSALAVPRPDPVAPPWNIFAPLKTRKCAPFKKASVKNGNAVTLALDYLLGNNSTAVLLGQDVGRYGAAFKTCKGLFDKYGHERVVDFPICESGTAGFVLGASQTGMLPIMEFQFADFCTGAVTQIGLNAATWYFRTGSPAQILFRMPSGAGIGLGAFHSGEFEGLWSRFPGLKLFYPTTPQETFEALVAGFYDPNPCIVFEHKLLYWTRGGDIDFDGDIEALYRPRCYSQGEDITIIAWGAMADLALLAVKETPYTAEVWNPFILNPLYVDQIGKSVEKTGRLLVVQESGKTAGIGNQIIGMLSALRFKYFKTAPSIVSSPDTPVPFAKELESHYLPDKQRVINAIEMVVGGNS